MLIIESMVIILDNLNFRLVNTELEKENGGEKVRIRKKGKTDVKNIFITVYLYGFFNRLKANTLCTLKSI